MTSDDKMYRETHTLENKGQGKRPAFLCRGVTSFSMGYPNISRDAILCTTDGEGAHLQRGHGECDGRGTVLAKVKRLYKRQVRDESPVAAGAVLVRIVGVAVDAVHGLCGPVLAGLNDAAHQQQYQIVGGQLDSVCASKGQRRATKDERRKRSIDTGENCRET